MCERDRERESVCVCVYVCVVVTSVSSSICAEALHKCMTCSVNGVILLLLAILPAIQA